MGAIEAQTAARNRPSRADIEPAAIAYQRGLEILLTKAPSTSEDDLVPWLKTVVKHEAFGVRKQRSRTPPLSALLDDGEEPADPPAPGTADEEAERYERLRLGAEEMGRLKPQEIRALLLKAEGLTYRETG